MIIEQFHKKPTRNGYRFNKSKFEYGFFMEFLFEEDYDLNDVFITVVEWVVKNFETFDRSKIAADCSDEFQWFIIRFKNEEDAMVFKMNPPFKEVRWTSGEDLSEEFDY